MRKTFKFCLLFLGGILVLPSFTATGDPKPMFPKKVDAIIQAKCYGCHSADSKAQKAKDKLNWDALAGLPKEQLLEKVKSIQDVLDKGSMPPARFLEKNPQDKLTDKETKAFKKWTSKKIKKLSK